VAGRPRLVKVDRGRKVVSYYIRVPYRPNDDFYFEFPLEEERLAEPIQLVDILPPENVEKFYADEVEDIMDSAEKRILQVASGKRSKDFVPLQDILLDTLEQIDLRYNNKGSIRRQKDH